MWGNGSMRSHIFLRMTEKVIESIMPGDGNRDMPPSVGTGVASLGPPKTWTWARFPKTHAAHLSVDINTACLVQYNKQSIHYLRMTKYSASNTAYLLKLPFSFTVILQKFPIFLGGFWMINPGKDWIDDPCSSINLINRSLEMILLGN